MPAQGWIDLLVYEIFHNDSELHVAYPHTGSSIGISDDINSARTAHKTRVKEDAEREAARKEKETEQLSKQQENAARQIALDANYKNISENYSTKIADLLNQSDINEALNLSNESIGALVSPYSNIMMITQGDIYMRLGKYQDAIESYNTAQTDFTYSNESAEYKNSIHRDFVENKWDRIVEMKIGIAKQNISEQMLAQIHDLRDAPDAKRLLAGHDQGRKYTVTMLNYTFLSSTIGSKLGYAVLVNVSAYDDPKATDVTKYMWKNIPMCIDMFAALFSDKKVSNVRIQTNESYFDKFGHIQERPFMIASLDNATATQIGDWATFKQYVGTDVSKFEQVIDLKVI
jgi:tetratricopeptide (TPR) repeat protein